MFNRLRFLVYKNHAHSLRAGNFKTANFNRFFSSAFKHPVDNITSQLKGEAGVLKKVNETLHLEYKQNKFALPIIQGLSSLLNNGKIRIIQSPTLEEDRFYFSRTADALAKFSFSGHGASESNHTIVLGSMDRFKIEDGFHSTHDGRVIAYFLHEGTHAFDHLVAKLSAKEMDKRNIIDALNSNKILTPLDFKDYVDPEMRSLNEAIIKDLKNVERLSLEGNEDATKLFQILNAIGNAYKLSEFLNEVKAYFVQLSTKGSLGAEMLQLYLPNISAWMTNELLSKAKEEPELSPSMNRLD